MDPALMLFTSLACAVAGYLLGRMATKFPSEEEMLRRLIVARTERLMIGVSEKDIKREVEQESDRIVRETLSSGHQ